MLPQTLSLIKITKNISHYEKCYVTIARVVDYGFITDHLHIYIYIYIYIN